MRWRSVAALAREVAARDGMISRISHCCGLVDSRVVGRLLNRVVGITKARRMFGGLKVRLD